MNAQCSTWREWEDFFHHHAHRLFHFEAKNVFAPCKDFLQFKGFVIDLHQQHRFIIDRAFRKFAINNRWQPLNLCQKYFLKKRLEFAKRCCIAAAAKKSIPLIDMPSPDAGIATVLKEVAIDGWDHDGVATWKFSLHSQWLQVMAGSVSQEEWQVLVRQLQQRRIMSLITHVRQETQINASGETVKHFDHYFQCADGSRWKGTGIGFAPTDVNHLQDVFNACPEDFHELPAGPS